MRLETFCFLGVLICANATPTRPPPSPITVRPPGSVPSDCRSSQEEIHAQRLYELELEMYHHELREYMKSQKEAYDAYIESLNKRPPSPPRRRTKRSLHGPGSAVAIEQWKIQQRLPKRPPPPSPRPRRLPLKCLPMTWPWRVLTRRDAEAQPYLTEDLVRKQ